MCATRGGWVVATSVGVVEALKDQGYCRWNATLRSLQQHAKNQLRAIAQAQTLSTSSGSAMSKKLMRDRGRMKRSEESLRTVMYLSCWGPNS